MFVEIPLLQKGSLYLGHPTYALSVVLFSMLIFTGLGSFLSSKFPMDRLARTVAACLLAVGLLVAVMTAALEWIVPNTIGLPLSLRMLIIVSITGAVALPMGTAFPSGIRLLARTREESIPWVWALNGGASVLGSIFAMALSMSVGYRMALTVGAAVYLLAATIVRPASRSVGPRPATHALSDSRPHFLEVTDPQRHETVTAALKG
jgi:hypothetical protein